MSATATFTPQQVLDAGKRAETEGRRDYAIQFYRHLTDHWADTPEASAARDGLARLGIRPAGQAHPNTQPPPPPYVYAPNGANGASPAAHTGYAPMPLPPALPNVKDSRDTAAPVHNATQHRTPVKYRAGRFVAGFIIGIGLLSMLAGVAFLAIAAAAWFGKPISLPGTVPAVDALVAGAAVAGGLFVMFIGQLAQAIFDGANALRDLALFEHERSGTKR